MSVNPAKALSAARILEKHKVVLPERTSKPAPVMGKEDARRIMDEIKQTRHISPKTRLGWANEDDWSWFSCRWPREGER